MSVPCTRRARRARKARVIPEGLLHRGTARCHDACPALRVGRGERAAEPRHAAHVRRPVSGFAFGLTPTYECRPRVPAACTDSIARTHPACAARTIPASSPAHTAPPSPRTCVSRIAAFVDSVMFASGPPPASSRPSNQPRSGRTATARRHELLRVQRRPERRHREGRTGVHQGQLRIVACRPPPPCSRQ